MSTITARRPAVHIVTVEPITAETAPHAPADATRAVVERYDGRLVKVIVTDADPLYATLNAYARSAARAYGATAVLDAETVADVLRKAARHVGAPMNASLAEALHLASRDRSLIAAAVDTLAGTLRCRPRALSLWDAARPRADVAAALARAAAAADDAAVAL